MSLSIIFSTREIEVEFINHVCTTAGIEGIEIIPYLNRGQFSLTELYNKGLQQARYDVIVFIHDDIIFNNSNWGISLLNQFKNTDYGILGIAGATDLSRDDDHPANHAIIPWSVGRLRHQVNGKLFDSFISNRYDQPVQVICLDGVFIAVNRDRIKEKFDERLKGFHFYDISFTFANYLAGVKVGVMFDIDLIHKSGGSYNEEWKKNRQLFYKLYKEFLPCRIKPEKIEYETTRIGKFNPGNSLVSIIIPTKDRIDLLTDCLQSIVEQTYVTKYEIIIADTGSTLENRRKLSDWIKNLDRKPNLVNSIKMVEYDYYNFARINNHVVKNHLSKKSTHILFCNNDIKILNDAVDRCLCLFREKKNIGTAGIRLHYADYSIQHNGIVLLFGITKLPVDLTHRNIQSYYRYDRNVVEVSGNTAAFLMIERSVFEKFYFNESYQECFEDVELNLQLLKLGRKNYQVGHAVAYHYESQTRNENPDKNKKLFQDYQNHLLPFFKRHIVPLFFAEMFEGASRASRAGQFETAVEICQMLLEHAPNHADVHHLLGVVYGRGGDQVRAAQQIRQAIALNSRMPSYHYNLAEALRRQSEWKLAEQSYRQALQLAPNMIDACVNLAIVLEQQERFNEALACYQQALRYNPNYVSAHCGMGDILRQLGAYAAAAECYQRALQLQPDLAEVHHNLGAVFYASYCFEEAAQCLRQALQYRPDLIEVWRSLGTLLERQGEVEEARECYQRVLAGGEDHALLRLRVASLCPVAPASNAAIDAYRAMAQAQLEEAHATVAGLQLNLQTLHTSGFEPPMLLAYQGRDDRPLKESWAALFRTLLPEVKPLSLANRRPHIGLVVTRGHEKVFLKGMGGVLNQASVGRFDWTIVCSQQNGEALLRAGIHNPAIRYLPLPERIDQSVELIRQGRFSVLHYWEVGTDSTNYFLPFFRLAPVQSTGWGWPVTSGIPHMDDYLSSEFLETAASDAHYSERLVRFQRLPVYFRRPELSQIPANRERFGIAADQHLYLCAQNLRKIHPDFDELIAGLLRRDPCGIVALVEDTHPAVTAAVRQRVQTRMPDVSERVRFLPRLAYEDYLSVLAAADVALDTLHFGGGITTYETLEMGTPIVTLPTTFSRGRYVYAAYRQMGLEEGIATDPDDYIERALRFASEPDYRAAFGVRLREASAELFEDQKAVREFEDFLEAAVAGL